MRAQADELASRPTSPSWPPRPSDSPSSPSPATPASSSRSTLVQVFAFMQKQGFFCQLPFDPTHTEIGASLSHCLSVAARRADAAFLPRRVHPHQQDHRAAVLEARRWAQENELEMASGAAASHPVHYCNSAPFALFSHARARCARSLRARESSLEVLDRRIGSSCARNSLLAQTSSSLSLSLNLCTECD